MLSPLNENGRPVDWWFLYKVPRMVASSRSARATGYEYVYFDPRVGRVLPSSSRLTSGRGALDLTLGALFASPRATTGWILYNDEMPACVRRSDRSALGHTKGVIAFDVKSESAFWLVHSWPQYSAPHVEKPTPMYGQTYLCVSLSLADARKLAAQMIDHQEPQTYLPRMPKMIDASDTLARLAQPFKPAPVGDSDVLHLSTRGGHPFKVIAKNRKWGRDFWNDLVGPTLRADIDCETWIRGPIASTRDSDGVHKTIDIHYVDLRPLGAPWSWPETHDHAKWAVTTKNDWVCVGDINRMISQEKRGGGTVAIQHPMLWRALGTTASARELRRRRF